MEGGNIEVICDPQHLCWLRTHGTDPHFADTRACGFSFFAQARDKSDSSVNSRDASAPRGRGGMGRRGTEDFADHGLKCADEERKSGKRRLFGSVLDRFDKADKDGGRGGGDATNSASTEQLSPPPKEGSRLPTEGRTWLTPGRGVVANGSLRDPDVSVSNAAEQSGASTAPGDGEGANAVRRGSGTWVKGSRSNNPERFTRFITKFIGVRDDAIPDDGAGSSAGGDRTRTESLDEPGRRQAARVNVVSDAAGDAASNAVTTDETSVNGGAGGRSIGGDGVRAESVPSASIPAETNVSSGGGAAVSSSGDRSSEEGATGITTPAEASAPVTATAVYDPSTVPFVTTDALPVAVAVAVPIEADSTTVASPECPPDRPLTRSVRPRRPGTTTTTTTTRTAAMAATGGGTMAGETAGRRTERGAPTVPSKVPVSISEWVAKEQRESGGVVRMFTAQRVVDGKVQKKCRLAVSPKNMTQVRDPLLGEFNMT